MLKTSAILMRPFAARRIYTIVDETLNPATRPNVGEHE